MTDLGGWEFTDWKLRGEGYDWDRERATIEATAESEAELPGWVVHLVMDARDSAIGVREVRVRPKSRRAPSGGLTTTVLRKVNVESIRLLARQRLASELRVYKRMASPALQREIARRARAFEVTRRPGVAGRHDSDYVALCMQYLEVLDTNPRQPVKELAKRTPYKEQTIRNLLWEAERRELIEDRHPGKPGFAFTDRGRQLRDELLEGS